MKKNVTINITDFNKCTGQQVKFYLDGTKEIRNNIVIGLENPKIIHESNALISVNGTYENSIEESGMLDGAWKSEIGKNGYFVTEASLRHICDVYGVTAEIIGETDDEHYIIQNDGTGAKVHKYF